MNQDIYENDAELDCNEFSNFLAEQKKEREAVTASAGSPPAGNVAESSSSTMQQDIYENDAELDCNEFSNILAGQKKEREAAAVPSVPSGCSVVESSSSSTIITQHQES